MDLMHDGWFGFVWVGAPEKAEYDERACLYGYFRETSLLLEMMMIIKLMSI